MTHGRVGCMSDKTERKRGKYIEKNNYYKNRLNELKQDKNVSEYIELSQTLCGINYETVINRTDDTLLYYAFCRYNNKIKESKEEDCTNNINLKEILETTKV